MNFFLMLTSAVYPFLQQCNNVQWLSRVMLAYLHQTHAWCGVPAFAADTVLSNAHEQTVLAGVVPWHYGTNHAQWPANCVYLIASRL
jgi:hypothetical protein